MATISLRAGLQVQVRYLLKQDGRYYYQHRIPIDLVGRYGKANIKVPLPAASVPDAAKQVQRIAVEHDLALVGNAPRLRFASG